MEESSREVSRPEDLRFRWRWLSLDPHVVVYSTIILLTAFALYDEGTEALFDGALLELIGISMAPLFALTMAHAFSDAIDMQIRTGHRLTGGERWHLLTKNLQYMLVGIPPTIMLCILTLLHWDANDAVGIIMIIGLLSLAFWGGYAAYKAALPVWRWITFGFGYGLMGLIVIIVELAITH